MTSTDYGLLHWMYRIMYPPCSRTSFWGCWERRWVSHMPLDSLHLSGRTRPYRALWDSEGSLDYPGSARQWTFPGFLQAFCQCWWRFLRFLKGCVFQHTLQTSVCVVMEAHWTEAAGPPTASSGCRGYHHAGQELHPPQTGIKCSSLLEYIKLLSASSFILFYSVPPSLHYSVV